MNITTTLVSSSSLSFIHMKHLIAFCLLLAMPLAGWSQDVTASYELSRLTGYIRLTHIGDGTCDELTAVIDSIDAKNHTANFVLDLLEADGDYGMPAVDVALQLLSQRQRFAILVGQKSGGAAEQVAMMMQNGKHAVTLGSRTKGGYLADMRYVSNDKYLTQWYDSICRYNIAEKTAREYARLNDVKAKYHNADDLVKNFDENGEMIDLLNEVAGREGIRRNDAAFFYGGYQVLCRCRAELVKIVYPESPDYYQKALNLPLQQAITDAQNILESSKYRDITTW